MRMAGNDLTEVGVTRGLWAGRVGVGTAVQAGGRGKGPVASVDGGDERVHAVTARRRPKSRERLTHFMAILSAPRIRGVAMAPPNGLELSRPARRQRMSLHSGATWLARLASIAALAGFAPATCWAAAWIQRPATVQQDRQSNNLNICGGDKLCDILNS